MQKITPFLWYDDNAEEAINFYTTVFKDAKIDSVHRNGEKLFTATFHLHGQEFMVINGGPMFKFTEAISLFVKCKDQEEVDYFWEKLSEDGVKSRCGWLKDKFGLSWQVVPDNLEKLLYNADPAKAQKVMEALMKMDKLVIKDLQDAAK
ncbi:Glyoxalase superfamily enzyme, possibly 3-demethylubiquinone-9 3-methyltransferase [Chitinophaga sp. YR573]|uniref:VOC family protein n=1 Tax=Chitinophaga sp. YR573 TaxID=1881040 RepID=UPI0008BDB0A5|nr:VOC family protein [Chitinophaga sp. YR573]SEW34951.1 Glyoxalase superfamily enzyme, possibly 3-demethylubiquinone-9 3-methyltransferase [Chitinophaga sp. YR573]